VIKELRLAYGLAAAPGVGGDHNRIRYLSKVSAYGPTAEGDENRIEDPCCL
jgi:hypothetical protein